MPNRPNGGTARYLAGLTHEIGRASLSGEDRHNVRQHLLDAVASAFIGCRGEAFSSFVSLFTRTDSGCTWPGGGTRRLSPIDAASAWAFAVNASVYEDGSREGACHPGAAVAPVVISLSEKADWEAVDRATVAGYDVMVRMARGGNPRFTLKGFHPTAITAPFGAAAAACIVLGLKPTETEHAFCLAALGSSGLMSAFKWGSTQPTQVAWAVRCGVSAAFMAGAGQKGYPRIIEEGFFPAYLGGEPEPAIEHPLSAGYAVRGSYLKAYPGCRHLHPSIDALVKILDEQTLSAEEIERIRVGTYKAAVETEIHELGSRGDAYFNIPYALSARIVLGRNDYDAFDEKYFVDPHIRQLMKRVLVTIDPEVDAPYPHQRGSRVEVLTRQGKTHSGEVAHPLGEPENPLPAGITKEKFRLATRDYLSEKQADDFETLMKSGIPDMTPQNLFEALGGEKV